MKTKIGILGSGVVGQVLANGFIKHGYEVMIGTNDPSKHVLLKEQTFGKAAIGNFDETSKFGDIIVLATKGSAVESAVKKINKANFTGKTIIDTTNPIADVAPVNGVLQYFTASGESLLERLQALIPEAHFVKAFNSVGNGLMINPDFNGDRPTMFICGNSDNAKLQVKQITETLGWDAEDMGKAEAARAIEPLCMLWCIQGFTKNQWNHAFKLLKQ
jgi:predicted dinucleotide-binding enzyme